ncbi:MAG: winged helix-turn-helix transcriptional regulator [Rhodobacteraceae bacterium]|nr:winged helix-turn-helix transcriptional regulator [Paracoccaceae bacterium]MBR9823562.1 winged helix-turn-helix transcriptional regulator [Paracoccaceae bacterium]
MDLDEYAPFLLNAVALAWTRQIAGVFKEDFGLGVVEWRVMAILSAQPGVPANQICEMLRMDKSAISRSLHMLAERGNLDHDAPTGDLRRREWRLSARGQALFEDLLAVALEAEARMLRGVSEDERHAFLGVMRRFLANLEG